MFNQIVFPPYEGLPFQVVPPTVDGYVEPEKLERTHQTGVPASPVDFQHPDPEVGYTHGARFSYEEGAGSGFAVAAFQGVWDPAKSLLYLGFVVRYDLSLDQEDRLVVVVKGSDGGVRRFDIQPNSSSTGAAAPDDPPRNPNLSEPTIHIRTGRQPFVFPAKFYQPNSGTGPVWVPAPAPDHFDVRVRTVLEEAGGAGSDGCYWSIEVQVPTQRLEGTSPGGASWLDLGSPFDLYVNLIRVGPSGPVIVEDLASIQSTWPYDPATPEAFVFEDPASGPLLPENWPLPTFGTAVLLPPGQPNPGKGIKFEQGVSSIGVLQSGVIGYQLEMIVGQANTLVARVVNTDPANPPPQIEAEFRLAEFGVGGGMPGVWDKPGSVPNPSAPATVPVPVGANPPAPVDLTSTWTITQADRTKYTGLWDDQCLWVLLSSASPANIVEASLRRNLTVKFMSSYAGGFVVSGSGYPPPAGGKHEFLLHSVTVPVDLTARDPVPEHGGGGPVREGAILDAGLAGPGDGQHGVVTWLWVTNAYRKTGKKLTLGKQRTAVYVHAGSFGHMFVHQLEAGETPQTVQLGVEFSGGGIRPGPRGLSVLQVPDGGRAVVGTRFSNVPKGEHHSGGGDSLAWWWRFLRWLYEWLRRHWPLGGRRPSP